MLRLAKRAYSTQGLRSEIAEAYRLARTSTDLQSVLDGTVRPLFRTMGGQGSVTLEHVTLPSAPGTGAGAVAAVLTLSRVDRRNALTGTMMAQLADHVDALAASPPPGGVLLRGAGRAFCSGSDLRFIAPGSPFMTPEFGGVMCLLMRNTLARLRALPVVSVSAVQGPAVGGGAELAVSCDYTLMSDDQRTHIHFVHARMGVTPGWGSLRPLQDRVSPATVLWLLGTAAPVGTSRATELGLAHAVSAPTAERFHDEALAFLARFSNAHESPSAVATLKRLSMGPPAVPTGVDAEVSALVRAWGGPAHCAAVERYLSSRGSSADSAE